MPDTLLNRREVVAELLVDRHDLLVVTGLGSPSYDVMAAGDHDLNYYLWGAMGGAAMLGLGLAHAQPDKPVLVITGDGEMLMATGALATIAIQAPANLTIAVLDNGHYGETGMQLSHTGRGVDLSRVAASMDFNYSERLTDMRSVQQLRDRIHTVSGLNFAAIAIDSAPIERVLPSRDGVYIKNRMKLALGQTL